MEKKLNPKQVHAATLLAHGATIASVSLDLGINPSTIHRWQKIPEFQCLNNSIVEELQASMTLKIGALMSIALDQLEALLIDPDLRPRDKLQAVAIALSHGSIRPLPMAGLTVTPEAMAKSQRETAWVFSELDASYG